MIEGWAYMHKVVYVGYTDRAKQTDELEDLEKDSRKVFMKLSYAFHL